MMRLSKSVVMAVTTTSLLSLAACASPARPEAMAVAVAASQSAQPGQRGYHQITVTSVGGGQDTNPLWMSNVSGADFQTALEESLRRANYLADGTGPLRLAVILEEVRQPMAGFDMTVTSRARYRLTDASGTVLFEESISASGTGTMGEAFAGVERLRIANEKSIQANLDAFLTRLTAALR